MIGADDAFFFMKPRGQRDAAVRADVAGDHHLTFNAIDNQLFVQQGGFHRGAANIAGAGHRCQQRASRSQSSGSKVQWAGASGWLSS